MPGQLKVDPAFIYKNIASHFYFFMNNIIFAIPNAQVVELVDTPA